MNHDGGHCCAHGRVPAPSAAVRPEDQIGMFDLMTPATRSRVLSEADSTPVFDLSVDYFVGMPSFTDAGDPPFQINLTHSPAGNIVDDAMGMGPEQTRLVSYSGDVISMYTHCGPPRHAQSLRVLRRDLERIPCGSGPRQPSLGGLRR